MKNNYPVVTLCGSTRFKDEFMQAQKKLTLKGMIVISVGLFGHSGDEEVWDGIGEGAISDTKYMLDDMHKRKIDMADYIYVINVGGYIGESTKSDRLQRPAQKVPRTAETNFYAALPKAGQGWKERPPGTKAPSAGKLFSFFPARPPPGSD